MNSVKVIRNANQVVTISILECGNGHRVKCVLTDSDPSETTIISQGDHYYVNDEIAITAFEGFCKGWASWLNVHSPTEVSSEQTAHDAFRVFIRSIPYEYVYTYNGMDYIISHGGNGSKYMVGFLDNGDLNYQYVDCAFE